MSDRLNSLKASLQVHPTYSLTPYSHLPGRLIMKLSTTISVLAIASAASAAVQVRMIKLATAFFATVIL